MNAEIITIGDEILIGQIVDTNSAWLSEQLNTAGIEVYQITSVHDDGGQIREAMARAAGKCDLVLLTGGLGPTRDDITKKAFCDFFGTRLVFDEAVYQQIEHRFRHRNIDMNKLNRDQALVPERSIVLPNRAGTAPGMWMEHEGTIFVSMPGVPFEMKQITEQELLPRLRATGRTKAIVHKTVLTQGLPESMLAERIEAWEDALPPHIRLAYLPNPMAVRLRLSAMGSDRKQLQSEVEAEIEKLKQLIPDNIFGYDNDTLAEVIGRLLTERSETLAVAESCTGGYIAHLITSVPGSSTYFRGGITAYANEVKSSLLQVDAALIEREGAVSEPVVRQMAEGVRNALQSTYAVATSGIAGPTGGTADKPVGTVWIAIATPGKTIAQKFIFGDNRERNIVRSAQTALQLLRRQIGH